MAELFARRLQQAYELRNHGVSRRFRVTDFHRSASVYSHFATVNATD